MNATGSDTGIGEYQSRMRALMVAALDFKHMRSIPNYFGGEQLRTDLVRVAEHYHDVHFHAQGGADAETQAAMTAVADDIAVCCEQGRWEDLQPAEWAYREVNRWWYEMSWLGRAWYIVRMKCLVPLIDRILAIFDKQT